MVVGGWWLVDSGRSWVQRCATNHYPRPAIHQLPTTNELEWNISVLLRRVLVAFAVERGERGDQLAACTAGPDDFVDEAASGGDSGVGELLPVLGDSCRADRRDIRGGLEL